MPLYQVTKVFKVEAASKEEAVEKVTNAPGELLEYVRVTEQADQTQPSGWKETLVKQLTGKKK